MTEWENKELEKIGGSEELKLTASRKDGTFYKPVIIWVVQVDNNLYIRSYKGSKGLWHQHIQLNQTGEISSGGITKKVNFIGIGNEDKALHDKIDQEYRIKYQKYGKAYVDPMISKQAQMTTTRLDPK